MRKIASILMPLLIMSTTLVCFSSCNNKNNKNCSQGLEFQLSSDETGYILTGIGDCKDTKLVIPPEHNGKPVISIDTFPYWENEFKFIQELFIPDSVESIGPSAFTDCINLTNVVIGDGVEYIGSCAFAGCTSLTNITVSKKNTAYKSVDGNLYSKDGKTLIQYSVGKTAGSFTIPESVVDIGEMAFLGCNSLTNVEFCDGLQNIYHYAFFECNSLTNIAIPNSVIGIWPRSFSNCSNLTSVVIGDGAEILYESTFTWCNSLTSIVIPKSIKTIFIDIQIPWSNNITSLYYKGSASDWANIYIDSILKNVKIYYYSENTPTEIGDHWYYDKNGNIVIW